jgi:hypothetical protein
MGVFRNAGMATLEMQDGNVRSHLIYLLYVDAVTCTAENKTCSHSFCEPSCLRNLLEFEIQKSSVTLLT